MDIRFSGKNLRITKGIKEHLFEKIGKLDKYAPRIVESHVVLKKEKYIYGAAITLLGKNFRAYGEGSQKENLYAAIDQAVDRVEKQLKKYRGKVKEHWKEHGETARPPKVKLADSAMREEKRPSRKRPAIIETQLDGKKPMNAQEASLQLEMAREPFLVFLNETTGQPSVIFKRADGNHGLFAPQI